jgi:acetolactate synthase-1/2/3 large subunit
MDSSPIVAITGNVTNALLGKDSFQEVDIAGITMPITKHNYIVKDVNDLADTIREAFEIARSGRPGPVLIDIPKDVTAAVCEYSPKKIDKTVQFKKLPEIEEEKIKEVAELINNAEKPFIYAGGGILISKSADDLKELADMEDIPVATSLMGIGAFDQSDRLSTGLIGMHGTVASNRCVVDCDLLLALGVRFSDRVLSNHKHFAENAKIVHVDCDIAEIGKNIKVDYPLVMDLKEFFTRLKKYLKPKKNTMWIALVDSWKDVFSENQVSASLRPRYFMEAIYKQTKGDCFISTEVGQAQMWAAQYFTYTKPKRLITSGGLGTMGFGLGAAIGTQFGNPEAYVFNIAGDGSFRMNMNELLTIRRYNLPIIEVIANNGTLGMVRQWQTAFYGKRYSQTTLDNNLNYEYLCKACDIDYYEAKTKEEYDNAIKQAIKNRKPCLINAYVALDEKVLPMVAPGKPIDDMLTK